MKYQNSAETKDDDVMGALATSSHQNQIFGPIKLDCESLDAMLLEAESQEENGGGNATNNSNSQGGSGEQTSEEKKAATSCSPRSSNGVSALQRDSKKKAATSKQFLLELIDDLGTRTAPALGGDNPTASETPATMTEDNRAIPISINLPLDLRSKSTTTSPV